MGCNRWTGDKCCVSGELGEKTDHSFLISINGFKADLFTDSDLSQGIDAVAIDIVVLVKHPVFSTDLFPISISIYSVKSEM